MLKATFSKKDIKLKQVLEIFAIEITSIDKDFKFKNKNFGSFIPTGMDDYHNGEIYTSEIFIKKGFFQKKKLSYLLNTLGLS